MSRMRVDNRDIADARIFDVFEHFPDIIHSVDEHGRIVSTNKKAESLLGYSRQELMGMDVRKIYADEILEALDKGFTALKKKGDATIPESILKAKDGTRIPVEIRSFSLYDDNGAFLRTFSILRDIRPIKELQNSLVHAGRLAAIGEMASGVAHDIKNPLTVILLALQLVTRELERPFDIWDEKKQRIGGFAHDIERASKSIQKLVDHLRNFSRGVAEAFETLDLYDTISDAMFITANKAKACSVMVHSDVPRGKCFTMGSPNQLEQVFVNLFANACDAMEGKPERKLFIRVGDVLRDNGAFWRVDVADTGPGIPPAIAESIFEAFFTTKEKGKGTGLGLSITRGIVKEHGGEVSVESPKGSGAVFSVLLPKAEAPAAKEP